MYGVERASEQSNTKSPPTPSQRGDMSRMAYFGQVCIVINHLFEFYPLLSGGVRGGLFICFFSEWIRVMGVFFPV